MSTVRNRDGGTHRNTRSVNVGDRVPTAAWPLDFEHLEATYDGAPDLICLSHLRWNFVYQRPQHLMSRCARRRRVFFVEEPIFDGNIAPAESRLDLTMSPSGVSIVVPHLSTSVTKEVEATTVLRGLVDGLFQQCGIQDCVLWYYTPMAMTFTRHIPSLAVVYDCMDELSMFRGAPGELREREAELMSRADVVFTGGLSLFEAKRRLHSNIHAFPSSIDYDHFAQARSLSVEPDDQKIIPRPRLGFAGVIDERLDTALLAGIAARRPDWHIVLVGPVVKLAPSELPRCNNIHYLDARPYPDLPAYIAGWDVALLPFARNESTRFISPTKTPEYLAAGRRVVSTSIRDVVRSYGDVGLVRIADSVDEFIRAVDATMEEADRDRGEWLARVDAYLAHSSWDDTWEKMMGLLDSAVESHSVRTQAAQVPNSVPSLPLRTVVVPARQPASGKEAV